MTQEELITKQQLEIEEYKKQVDKIIKQLSKIQVKLMQIGITNEEYNEVIDFIQDAKEYLANMQSYNVA